MSLMNRARILQHLLSSNQFAIMPPEQRAEIMNSLDTMSDEDASRISNSFAPIQSQGRSNQGGDYGEIAEGVGKEVLKNKLKGLSGGLTGSSSAAAAAPDKLASAYAAGTSEAAGGSTGLEGFASLSGSRGSEAGGLSQFYSSGAGATGSAGGGTAAGGGSSSAAGGLAAMWPAAIVAAAIANESYARDRGYRPESKSEHFKDLLTSKVANTDAERRWGPQLGLKEGSFGNKAFSWLSNPLGKLIG